MDTKEKYFSNISDRERAIFEGAISMGALFHQFVGTPFNKTNIPSLEKAMEVRRMWMQALSGKISKKELDAKGIRFMAVAE